MRLRKTKFLFLLLFLLTAGFANAQTLYFCEGVDEDGYPENESSVFTIPEDGGYLYFLVRMPSDLDSYSVDFIIYSVDSDGEEIYDNTISMDTELEWTYFWKQINFYRSGKYKVYVYDDEDYLLTSGTVRISYE